MVFLYNTGNEHMLPAHFRRQIPYATRSKWRKADLSTYKGHEFRKLFSLNSDHAGLLYENSRMKQAMLAFARARVCLSSAIVPIVKKAQGDIVNLPVISNLTEFLALNNYFLFTSAIRITLQL